MFEGLAPLFFNQKKVLTFHVPAQEEESGSSTDMSICRSEVLFSSMRDSIGAGVGIGMGMHSTGVGLGQAEKLAGFGSNINPPGSKEVGINSEKAQFFGGASAGPKLLEEDLASSLILIQDSLINLSFSEQVYHWIEFLCRVIVFKLYFTIFDIV